jgi:hypothetical protein
VGIPEAQAFVETSDFATGANLDARVREAEPTQPGYRKPSPRDLDARVREAEPHGDRRRIRHHRTSTRVREAEQR